MRRPRPYAAYNAAAIAAVWLTSLVTVALWVHGGGVQALTQGLGPAAKSLGRLTGFASAQLLLFQVVLMARIPLFEYGFGRAAMLRVHRQTAIWSVALVGAHIIFLAAGDSLLAGMNPFTVVWLYIVRYPGVLPATAGTLVLLGVGLTSMRRARRRLRYEAWHLLHLYGYLGAGIAVPHQLWTGTTFLHHPVATAYWWTLWGVAFGCVIIWRLVIPVVRSLSHHITVEAVVPDGPHAVIVHMNGRRLTSLRAEPGQFFVFRFLSGKLWTRGNPFSLCAPVTDGRMTISVHIVGDGTTRIAHLKRGTRVLVEGPYGTFGASFRPWSPVVMIGAGSGVAPLVSLLSEKQYEPGQAVLLQRASTSADLMLTRQIKQLAARRGVVPYQFVGSRDHDGWLPQGFPPDRANYLRSVIPKISAYDAYLCGPSSWIRAVRADLRAAGIPPRHIHTEAFDV